MRQVADREDFGQRFVFVGHPKGRWQRLLALVGFRYVSLYPITLHYVTPSRHVQEVSLREGACRYVNVT